jgi:hypothetical protein
MGLLAIIVRCFTAGRCTEIGILAGMRCLAGRLLHREGCCRRGYVQGCWAAVVRSSLELDKECT